MTIEERAWGQPDDEKEKGYKKAEIFLVYAPLTFGHSQLCMTFEKDTEESHQFHEAARLIERAVRVFRTQLDQLSGDLTFKALADLALTHGSYVKTLILRTSASERSEEYKVHLVPYFSSHARRCQKLWTSIHNVPCDEEGGLIKWLGERETIADTWLNKKDNPFTATSDCAGTDLDIIATKKLKMDMLAQRLRQAWGETKGMV